MARILIVDDDASIRFLLRGVLEMHQYEVVEADNGAAGLECYWEEVPDLVITDLQMPVMDGLQLMIELRRVRPAVRIIAISGGQKALYMARSFAQRVFEKPFRMGDLMAAVCELVSGVDSPVRQHAIRVSA